MRLEQMGSRFQKVSKQRELKYSLAGAVAEEDILSAEQRLSLSFPEQVKLFYRNFNGLRVDDPQLEVLPVGRLDFASPDRLHFATVDGKRGIFCDVSHINVAGQWDIVASDDYRATFTMASFWTTTIWAWVEKRRPIWQNEAPT
jgi:cell wall assembly regulator SMI1